VTPDLPPSRPFRRWLPFAIGALAGAGIAAALFARVGRERVVARPLAPAEEVAVWDEEGARRSPRLAEFPDPPGDGPVIRAQYRVSLPAYEMEVRRRGHRLTLGIRGTDVQVAGGAWIAFGEGRIDGGRDDAFGGSVARIAWSCVGLRFRTSSDGVARILFSPDGTTLTVHYLQGQEALLVESPDTYVKAEGVLSRGPRPPYGAILGQVPFTARMRAHASDARVVVTGRVVTTEGAAVPDALVQLKGVDATRVHADDEGRFSLEFRGAAAPRSQSICAGAAGHRNGETVLFTGDPTTGVEVELAPVPPGDHAGYAWVHPAPDRDPDDAQACGTCHSWQYTEWLGSRHARAADNGQVRHERDRMRRAAPEAPDDCVACHQPALAATQGAVPYAPRGVLAGNHCDFCHKIRHVEDVGKPGVLGSLALARPDPARRERPGDLHVVFGPAADVTFAYMGASWNPLFASSWLCAGCHQGGGLPGRAKVDTFEEWRAWAADREDERFRSCQDCHMPGGTTVREDGGRVDQIAWDALHRAPQAVHAHSFPGTGASFARDALRVEVEKRLDPATGTWEVEVAVTNVGAGHRVPTGTWTKHVAIGVWARRGDRWLLAKDGERAVLGARAPADEALAGGDWRGPPGALLGVFRRGKEEEPASFWDPPTPADTVDTRLAPDETRTIRARFVDVPGAPAGDPPVVEVRAVHRRGAIGSGHAGTPWEPRPNDAPPEVEWWRIER
jgi:hypothetical protein